MMLYLSDGCRVRSAGRDIPRGGGGGRERAVVINMCMFGTAPGIGDNP